MPTDTRSRKTNYSYYSKNRTYTSTAGTSAAYDIPAYYPERTSTRAPRRTYNNPAIERQTPRVASRKSSSVAINARIRKGVAICAVVFVAALIILCRYVSILNQTREISELEKQYAEIVSDNQGMQVKISGMIENGEIEKIAKEDLGMMEPEEYQKFYIQMKMPDSGSDGSISKSSAVMGTAGTLLNAFRVVR